MLGVAPTHLCSVRTAAHEQAWSAAVHGTTCTKRNRRHDDIQHCANVRCLRSTIFARTHPCILCLSRAPRRPEHRHDKRRTYAGSKDCAMGEVRRRPQGRHPFRARDERRLVCSHGCRVASSGSGATRQTELHRGLEHQRHCHDDATRAADAMRIAQCAAAIAAKASYVYTGCEQCGYAIMLQPFTVAANVRVRVCTSIRAQSSLPV